MMWLTPGKRHVLFRERFLIKPSPFLLLSLCFLLVLGGGHPSQAHDPFRPRIAPGLSVQAVNWQRLPAPLQKAGVHDVQRDPYQSDRLYAATRRGLYLSDDGGTHWRRLAVPIDGHPSQDVLAVAHTPKKVFLLAGGKILVSPNEGRSWHSQADLPPDISPLTLAVTPHEPEVLYLGTRRSGVLRSRDGGHHWQSVNCGLPPAVGVARVTPVAHLIINPLHPQTLYAATEVHGIYISHDGGEHWYAAQDGLPGPLPYRTYPPLLAIDHHRPDVLYVLMGYPVHSHKIENRLYRSTDGGGHWEWVARLPDNIAFGWLTLDSRPRPRLTMGSEMGMLMWEDDELPAPRDVQPRAWSELHHRPLLTDPRSVRSWTVTQSPADFDVGNIAVLHDDGTLTHVFDLNGRSIEFQRVSNRTYTASFVPFTFDTEPGTPLSLGDDDFTSVPIPFSFRFYNRSRDTVFINSNGNLTFSRGTRNATPVLGSVVGRISGFWADLDPSQGGMVTVRSDTDRLVITWDHVPEAGTGAANTFQIVLFNDDRIMISFSDVQSKIGLTGITPGTLFPTEIDYTDELPLDRARRAILELFDGAFQIHAIGRRFYQTHPDDFDFLVVFGASDYPYDVITNGFAFHAAIQNDVQGIGRSLGTFNGGPAAFGSAGRLQSFLNMNKLSEYPDNPTQTFLHTNSTLDILAQETGHRWLAYVQFNDNGTPSSDLLGRGFSHWSFFHDTDASEMEGNNWLDNGNGSFTSIEATTRYSMLDRYLMGLAAPSEVPPFFYIKDPTETDGRTASSPPEVGVTIMGTRRDVTVTQVIEVEGQRTPPYPIAPRHFTQAFLLVVPPGSAVSAADINKLETIRRSWELFFNFITGGRATIETQLPGATGADLLATNLSVAPSTVPPGATVTLTLTILNQGTVTAGAATHEIRFSDDTVIDESDPLLATLVTSSLTPGGSAQFTLSVTIPVTSAAGQKYIGIRVDATNEVPETNENNNIALLPLMITGGSGADLVPTDFNLSPTVVPAGGTITVTVTIRNQGSAPAPQATHEIRLSPDSLIDASDTFLTGFITGQLAPGAAVTFTINTLIPADTPAGGWFVGTIADATDQVVETDETNNTVAMPITVTN